MKAISLRQPWAYLVANGIKGIENRKWKTKFRGPVLIHASKGYDEWLPEYEVKYGVKLPCHVADLPRGGIVGIMTITDCAHLDELPLLDLTEEQKKWFWGPYGFTVTNARPLPFWPCKGMLSFFEVDYPLLQAKTRKHPVTAKIES